MQTLKLSLCLPDANHPNMQLHVSSSDADCDVVIELPARARGSVTNPPDGPTAVEDDYVLGGYAGI
jgi:hypothetical protein